MPPESPLAEWHGYVSNVAGDTFTAILSREGDPGIMADFSMSECELPGITPGDLLVVTPDRVRRLELPPWTREELDDIQAQARRQAAELNPHVR